MELAFVPWLTAKPTNSGTDLREPRSRSLDRIGKNRRIEACQPSRSRVRRQLSRVQDRICIPAATCLYLGLATRPRRPSTRRTRSPGSGPKFSRRRARDSAAFARSRLLNDAGSFFTQRDCASRRGLRSKIGYRDRRALRRLRSRESLQFG